MAKSSGRGSSGAGTIIWAVAAVALVAAFLYWISITAEPSVPPEVAAPEEDAAAVVTAAEFEPAIATWIGRDVQLQNVAVLQHTGAALLWVELPSGSPYLVKASDAVAANGLPDAGSTVTIVGTVRQKGPAVLDGWVGSGVLTQAQRAEAEYGDTYIDATAIRAGG